MVCFVQLHSSLPPALQETVGPDIDGLVRGMTSTLAEQEDHIVVPDLRGK
jgi:hypothetical protein